MESVNVRNLEQIQEDDPRTRSSRLGALILASLGGAALVTVAVLTVRRSEPPADPQADPLAALIADAKEAETKAPNEIHGDDATFPGVLSDDERPTTALAAVTDAKGGLVPQPPGAAPQGPLEPPAAADRLPVVPLPAGTLLNSTPVTSQPKDSLAALAASRSSVDDSVELAPPGTEGGFQIQVASFKKQEDADAFVEKLRKRGHSAYRQAAHVPGRGLWHRVRVGPFKSKFSAIQYKKKFERTERVSPFVVDPYKVKQQKEIRAAKLAARKRRYGKP